MVVCTLAVLAVSLAGPPKVSFRQESLNRKGWYEVSATIPRFLGNDLAKLASGTAERVARSRTGMFRKEYDANPKPERMGYLDWSTVVSLATDHLISLYGQCDYYAGGAHGNYDFAGLNFGDVKGKPKRLVLADLVVPGLDPVQVASELVIPKLRTMGASSVTEGEVERLSKEQADNFVVTQAGITWLFAPYEVASYAEGSFMVKVKWEEMQGKVTRVP